MPMPIFREQWPIYNANTQGNIDRRQRCIPVLFAPAAQPVNHSGQPPGWGQSVCGWWRPGDPAPPEAGWGPAKERRTAVGQALWCKHCHPTLRYSFITFRDGLPQQSSANSQECLLTSKHCLVELLTAFIKLQWSILWKCSIKNSKSGLILNHLCPLLFTASNFGAARVYVEFLLNYTVKIYFWCHVFYHELQTLSLWPDLQSLWEYWAASEKTPN